MNKKNCFNGYDKIAGLYESLFNDEESKQENSVVSSMLSGFHGCVYDIGCGTGLLLSLMSINPKDYNGVDPSEKMIGILKEKYPAYKNHVTICNAEDAYTHFSKGDNIISLFGSISYVDKRYLENVEKSAANLFLMFYRDDYVPVTYKKTGVFLEHNKYSLQELKKMFSDCYVFEFNRYYIVKR